jgi:hypothetical protein
MRNTFKNSLLALSLLASAGAITPAFAADKLEVRNFIGTINWSNGDMNVEVDENIGRTKVQGRNDIVIDGGQDDINGKKCKSSYGSFSVDWFGKEKSGRFGGYEDLDEMPILTITVPDDTNLIINNSILFTDGAPDVGSADIDLRYCGAVQLGDIDGTLALNSRGSADLIVGSSDEMAVVLKGSGDLTGGNSGDVLIKSQGSGDVDLEDIGALDATLQGSGDLSAANVSGNVTLSSSGSGDIELDDVEGDFTHSSQGSGDLDIDSLNSRNADIKSSGSGDIDIEGGQIESLTAVARGSATIEFAGDVTNATLRATGSGDIRIDRVTGDVEIRSSGSGDVHIDERSE